MRRGLATTQSRPPEKSLLPPPFEAVSAAVNCPLDYPAVAALGIASGAVASRLRLQIKKGWVETAALYTGYVAPPGDGKTAPLSAVRSPELLVIVTDVVMAGEELKAANVPFVHGVI